MTRASCSGRSSSTTRIVPLLMQPPVQWRSAAAAASTRRDARQVDVDARAATLLRVQRQIAAVRFGDGLHDRQPQARAGRARGEEWLEHLRLEARRDAGAIVANRELDAVAAHASLQRHDRRRVRIRMRC